MKVFFNVFFEKNIASELAIRCVVFTQGLLLVVIICILGLGCKKNSDENLPTPPNENLPAAIDLNNNDQVINASLEGVYSLPCHEQWTLYIGEFIPGKAGTASAITIPCSNENYSCSGVDGENVAFIGFAAGTSGNTQYSGPAYDVSMQCMAGSQPNVTANALHHELVHLFYIMNGIFDHDERQIHCIASSIPNICPSANNDVQAILNCLYDSELFQREVSVVGLTGGAPAFAWFFLVYVHPGCGNFQVVSDDNWITIRRIDHGNSDLDGIVVVDVLCNDGPPRSGSLRVAGNLIEVQQDGPWLFGCE